MTKIAILGLGYSLNEYDSKEFDFTIGVNDIFRYHKTDALVVVNAPKEFTFERLNIINESTPKVFYSQMVIWDTRPDFKKINILPGYPTFYNLDQPAFYKSFTSIFIAVQIGYKLHNGNELHVFGADMTNHPHLNGELCNKIKLHFVNLKAALRAKRCELVIHGSGILQNI